MLLVGCPIGKRYGGRFPRLGCALPARTVAVLERWLVFQHFHALSLSPLVGFSGVTTKARQASKQAIPNTSTPRIFHASL